MKRASFWCDEIGLALDWSDVRVAKTRNGKFARTASIVLQALGEPPLSFEFLRAAIDRLQSRGFNRNGPEDEKVDSKSP
jgi:hypothetical protein